MSSNVSAWALLAARAMRALRLVAQSGSPSSSRRQLRHFGHAAKSLRKRIGKFDALQQRGRAVPVGTAVRPTGGRAGGESALTEELEGRERPCILLIRGLAVSGVPSAR